MGGQRHDQIAESLITLKEATEILELPEEEVQQLILDHKVTAYELGDQVVRLRKDQIWELKSRARISADLFPVDRTLHHNVPVRIEGTRGERIKDFFYFNDFYIISFVVITALLYLIVSSH